MNKQKKKLPLAMQIFIALILAIVVGLLMQSQAAFTENYIKPFGTIFLNLLKFYCSSDCIIFYYVWNHIYEGY